MKAAERLRKEEHGRARAGEMHAGRGDRRHGAGRRRSSSQEMATGGRNGKVHPLSGPLWNALAYVGVFLGQLAAWSMALMPLLWPLSVARAQEIVIDPSAPRTARPGLSRSAGGVPVIDIVTPKSGISHNRFRALSSRSGLIFNNSPKGGVSVTGGWVHGNANLATSGPARVILNEVRGERPTELGGAIEIFGRRAELIFANENGIFCDGCRVINASRLVLSTGRPEILPGGRVRLEVRKGTIGITGGGLETVASGILLSGRHVVVTGGVRAGDRLRVIGGAHRLDLDTGRVTVRPGLEREAPHAVDVTASGYLLGPSLQVESAEAGLGLRLAGYLESGGRMLVMSSDSLEVGRVRSGGDATFQAVGRIVVKGNGDVGGALALEGHSVAVSGKVSAGETVSIRADSDVDVGGQLTGREIVISAENDVRNFGRMLAEAGVSIDGRGMINVRPVQSRFGDAAFDRDIERQLDWLHQSLRNDPDSAIAAYYRELIDRRDSAPILLTEGQGIGGEVSGLSISITAREGDFENRGGRIEAGEDLSVMAGRNVLGRDVDSSHASLLVAGRDLRIEAGGDISNEGGAYRASGYLELSAGGGVRLTPGSLAGGDGTDVALLAGQGLRILASGEVSVTNYTVERGAVDIEAGDGIRLADEREGLPPLSLDSVRVTTARGDILIARDALVESDIDVRAPGSVSLGWHAAGGDVLVSAQTGDVTSAGVRAAGDVSLQAGGAVSLSGPLAAGGDLIVTGQNGDVRLSVAAVAGRSLSVVGGGDIRADGVAVHAGAALQMQAGGDIVLASRTGRFEERAVWDLASLPALDPAWLEERRGGLARFRAEAGTQLQISAGGDIELAAARLAGGDRLEVLAQGHVTGTRLTAEGGREWGNVFRAGTLQIVAGGNLALDLPVLEARTSALSAGGERLELTGYESLDAAGLVTFRTAGLLKLHGERLDARRVDMGQPSAIDLAGLVEYGDLPVVWRELRYFANRGRIRAGKFDIEAGEVIGNGQFEATGAVRLVATAGDLLAERIEGDSLNLMASGGIRLDMGAWAREDVNALAEAGGIALGAVEAGGALVAVAQDALTAGDITARSADLLSRAGDIRLGGRLATAEQATLLAEAGGIALGTVEAGGALVAAARHELTAGALSASAVQLDSREGGIRLDGVLRAGEDVLLTAGKDIAVNGIVARHVSVISREGAIDLGGLGEGTPYEFGGNLYLDAARTLRFAGGVRLHAGGDMSLQSGENIEIVGVVTADEHIPTRLSAGGDLWLNARGSVINRGGLVTADGNLTVLAGQDILNEALRREFQLDNGLPAFDWEPAEMRAGGGLILRAGNDVRNVGSKFVGREFVRIDAGRDVVIEGLADKYVSHHYYRVKKKKKWWGKKTVKVWYQHHEKEVLAPALVQSDEGEVWIEAGRDMINAGGLITARGDLTINAARNVELLTRKVELLNVDYYRKKSSWLGLVSLSKELDSEEWNSFAVLNPGLKGRNIRIYAGQDLIAQGAVLHGEQDIELSVAGNIRLEPLTLDYYRYVEKRKSGFLGLFKKRYDYTEEKRLIEGTQLFTDKDISLTAEQGSVILRAARLEAGENIHLSAPKGVVWLGAEQAREFRREYTYKQNPVWWKSRDRGSEVVRAVMTHLQAGGAIRIEAGQGVIVEYRELPGQSLEEALASLAKVPSLKWVADLRGRNDVVFRAVAEASRNWDYKAQGLTQGAAAFIMLAVGLATQGMGSSLLGVAGDTMLGAALDAGFSHLVGRATVALINNQGDILGALKELGSSDSIKSLVTSMVTAGLMNGLDSTVLSDATWRVPSEFEQFATGNILTKLDTLGVDLTRSIIRASVRAGISSAIQGGDFADALLDNLVDAAVSVIGAAASQQIGILQKSGQIGDLSHKIAHGLLGCLVGAASSGAKGCAAGATGAVVAETVAELYNDARIAEAISALRTGEQLSPAMLQEIRADAQLAGKLAAMASLLATGQDVDIGFGAASNAVDNNLLCGGACIAAVIAIAGFAFTAKDVYDAYNEEGIEAALMVLARDGLISIVSAGAGKVVYKVGGKIYSSAPEAWKAIQNSPLAQRIRKSETFQRLINSDLNRKNLAAAQRLAQNRELGLEFERAVLDYLKLNPNREAFTVTLSDGRKVITIPDAVCGNSIMECKNVIKLSSSPQLKAQIQLARETGKGYMLVISHRTQEIAPSIVELIDKTKGGKIMRFDPVRKEMIPVEIKDGRAILQ